MLLLAGCSREQQDWRSAEAADSIESYGQFLQRHPESELATQARTRVAQLGEDRDWQHAGSADTVDAYRAFIAQHPNGKWAQEAHIRIDNFSLGEQKGTDAGTKAGPANRADAQTTTAAGTATATAPGIAAAGAQSYGLASPGEAASAAPSAARSPTARSGSTATPAAATPAQAAATPSPFPAATPNRAVPPPTTAPIQGRMPGYGIQLGAFSTEAGAMNEWHLLAARYAAELQGLQEHVVAADMAAGRIYRLQAAVVDEGHARSICDLLRRRGQACVAVLPH
jgi:cell division septation protein DedD